jgi:hypothetical protein
MVGWGLGQQECVPASEFFFQQMHCRQPVMLLTAMFAFHELPTYLQCMIHAGNFMDLAAMRPAAWKAALSSQQASCSCD